MKTAGIADLLQGQRRVPDQSVRDLKSVTDQCVHRRTAHIRLKTPPRFASAYIGCFRNIIERDGLCIMFPYIRKHLPHPYLRIDLNARAFRSGQRIEMQKQIFKYFAEIALDSHFVTSPLFAHQRIYILDQPVHLILPADGAVKHNKRQGIAAGNRLNILSVDFAVFGRNRVPRKHDIRHGIRKRSGYLLYAVQYVPVDEYTFARIEQNVLSADLKVQNAAHCRSDFKIGMPMQRPLPLRKQSKFAAKKRDGKHRVATAYLLPELMI